MGAAWQIIAAVRQERKQRYKNCIPFLLPACDTMAANASHSGALPHQCAWVLRSRKTKEAMGPQAAAVALLAR